MNEIVEKSIAPYRIEEQLQRVAPKFYISTNRSPKRS